MKYSRGTISYISLKFISKICFKGLFKSSMQGPSIRSTYSVFFDNHLVSEFSKTTTLKIFLFCLAKCYKRQFDIFKALSLILVSIQHTLNHCEVKF